MGLVMDWFRARRPLAAKLVDIVKQVVVGNPARPASESPEAAVGAPLLAIVRKAVAGAVSGLIAWILAKTGIDLGFISQEASEILVSMAVGFVLVWRTPNATKA